MEVLVGLTDKPHRIWRRAVATLAWNTSQSPPSCGSGPHGYAHMEPGMETLTILTSEHIYSFSSLTLLIITSYEGPNDLRVQGLRIILPSSSPHLPEGGMCAHFSTLELARRESGITVGNMRITQSCWQSSSYELYF